MSADYNYKRKKKLVIRRTPDDEALKQVKKGKKFIIVNNDFTAIPPGFMLIDMKYKGDSFKTLVPQNLLYYLANPGEGNDFDDALDEITDFYSNVEDYEDELLDEGKSSVQGVEWAVSARSAYETYLINKLTQASKKDVDIPEWNAETMKELDLTDPYVAERARAMAALMLGKTTEELKGYNIESVLKHITINERKEVPLTKEEFDKITCWAGSHYEIKEEYRKKGGDVEYDIDRRHDTNHKVGKKIVHKQEIKVLDSKIEELEKEIEEHRKKKGKKIGKHDKMLTRQYVNVTYIAKENPQKQLNIKPNTEE